jgi:hypothetical protein
VNRVSAIWIHLLVLAGTVVAAILDVIPWLAVLPFAGFLARSIWAAARVRPVVNVKRFGFTEIGAEILAGLFVAAGWVL